MIKAWWDYVKRRDGWSAQIGIWPLLALHSLFAIAVSVPLIAILTWIFDGAVNWTWAISLPLLIVAPAFVTLTGTHTSWKEDQAKLKATD